MAGCSHQACKTSGNVVRALLCATSTSSLVCSSSKTSAGISIFKGRLTELRYLRMGGSRFALPAQ